MNLIAVRFCARSNRWCALVVLLSLAGCDSTPASKPPTKTKNDTTANPPAAAQRDKSAKPAGEPDKSAGSKAPTEPAVGDGAAQFVDVAAAVGLERVLYCGGMAKNHILESVGSGCAWIDYDEDGWRDKDYNDGSDISLVK